MDSVTTTSNSFEDSSYDNQAAFQGDYSQLLETDTVTSPDTHSTGPCTKLVPTTQQEHVTSDREHSNTDAKVDKDSCSIAQNDTDSDHSEEKHIKPVTGVAATHSSSSDEDSESHGEVKAAASAGDQSGDTDRDVSDVSEGEVEVALGEEGDDPSLSHDELETMRKQGAIPKYFNRPLPPVPEPSNSEGMHNDVHLCIYL